MIYRDYDQAGLDGQYNLRLSVDNVPGYFDGWAEMSEAARKRHKCTLDVAYGKSLGQTMDIFAPGDAENAPVHVFIHGGYWFSRDKEEFSYLANGLVPAGGLLVAVNYDLAPHVTMDEIVRQNRAALAWLWRNVSRYGGNPERIFVSGHSAGGHLTAMMAITDWRAFDTDLPADLVKGGCGISGIYDLEPIRLCYLNENLHLDEATAARNSPLYHIPASAPPLILCVGGIETDEYHRHQRTFADAWSRAGLAVQEVEAPGLHHFNVVDELGKPGSPLNRAVLEQMSL
jgi:arylformamidase